MIDLPIIVLAGGFGTRLKTEIGDLPKPLAPVAGRPFIEYFLLALQAQGARRVILSLYYQADQLIDFARGYAGLTIDHVVEPEALGTGGALAYCVREAKLADKPIIVCNGDTFLSSGLVAINEVALAPGGGCVGLVRVDNTDRYGAVDLDDDGRIVRFREKQADSGGGLINCGFYKLDPAVFHNRTGRFSLEEVIFPELTTAGTLRGVELDASFIDIGIPADYHRFERMVEAGEVKTG